MDACVDFCSVGDSSSCTLLLMGIMVGIEEGGCFFYDIFLFFNLKLKEILYFYTTLMQSEIGDDFCKFPKY